MDKAKIQSDYLKAFGSKSSVSGVLISLLKVTGGVSFVFSFVVFVVSLISFVGGGDRASSIYMVASLASAVQSALFVLVAEIGSVARDNSRMLRRIAAGFVKTAQ